MPPSSFPLLLIAAAILPMYVTSSSSPLDAKLCSSSSAMGNCLPLPVSPLLGAKEGASKAKSSLPIDKTFTFPSPPPSWPKAGGGFASGTIDLGGLQARQVSSFTKVFAVLRGGPGDMGATFFEPAALPDGFSMIGSYAQPNNRALFGRLLVVKDTSTGEALKPPLDYSLLWSSNSSDTEGHGYFWLPVAPGGYKPAGILVTGSPEKPPLDRIRCVRSDLTEPCEAGDFIWATDDSRFTVSGSTPSRRGVQEKGVMAGTFVCQPNGAEQVQSLRNSNGSASPMPDPTQVRSLFRAYAPLINFHPQEEFLPSSVRWFFANGALLYTKGKEASPVPIDPTGKSLPRVRTDDGAHWLDLPAGGAARDIVKAGDLQSAEGYLHVKAMFGSTFTDMAVWVFFPFNGAARAKVGFVDYVSLGKMGEHVGDWEHVSLRISNFDGELRSVFFSEHSQGRWVAVPEVEFGEGANRVVAYASYHGHATYARPGLVLQGGGAVGIRNDAAKGGKVMDTGAKYWVVTAQGPPWVEYPYKWGPNVSYREVSEEMGRVKRMLVGKLKSEFEKLVEGLPAQVFGEDGPTGPKFKPNWLGDETA